MYDAVVIGAGMGGLTAALELLLKGKKIVLFEQRNIPGGISSSLVRGRFEFETSLYGIQGIGPKENPKVIRKFFQDAGVKIEFLPIQEAYRLIIKHENLDIVLPYNAEKMIEIIDREAPGSKVPLTNLLELCDEINESVNYISQNKEKAGSLQTFANQKSFFRTSGYTAAEVIKTFKLPKRALNILYPYWINLGVPLDKVSFVTWASMLSEFFSDGAAVIKNNSFELSLAIEKRIRELGGLIKYNTRIDRILVESGEIIGVVTNKNETIKTKYVVSSAYPNKVYGNMLYPVEALPKIAYKVNNSRQLGSSVFSVFLGLDAEPKMLKIDNYSYFVSSTTDLHEMYESTKNLNAPKYFTAICLNNILTECTPNGTAQLVISAVQSGEVWEHIMPENYSKVKREFAFTLIKKFSEVLGIDLFKHIEEIEITTPITIARKTGAWNGSIFGYEHRPWDSIATRIGTEDVEKYIKGLEFAGAHAAHGNGHAYCIKSGKKAATAILRQMKESE